MVLMYGLYVLELRLLLELEHVRRLLELWLERLLGSGFGWLFVVG